MANLIIRLAIVLSFIVLSFQICLAVDELHLTGIIKSYNKEQGIIWVDVKSEGCKGLREFRVPEDARADLEPSLIGQRIEFHIDSDRCEKGRLYKMILGGKR